MRVAMILVVVVVLAALVWVRVAPSDTDVWHVAPEVAGDVDLAGGVMRRVEAKAGAFEQLDRIIRATPRTEVLAGSVEEGRVTYVTRSRWIGFPDYTTVQQSGEALEIHARLRFGGSDLGVNRERVTGWLQMLGALES